MQKPKRRSYLIDLNSPAARGNLKILAFLYPVWGIVLPFYALISGVPNIRVTHILPYYEQPILLALYLGLVFLSISILTNRMIITGKTIRFGHRMHLAFKTSSLKNLFLDNSLIAQTKSLVRFKFGNYPKAETIDTAGMEDRMKARLMAAIDNLAPQCQTPREVRTLLGQSSRKETIKRDGDTITMPYHSHLLMMQVKERIDTYQRIFWSVWGLTFSGASVFLTPVFIALALEDFWQNWLHTSCSPREMTDIMNGWLNMWSFIKPVMNGTMDSTNAILQASSDPSGALTCCAVAGVAFACLLTYLGRPNLLRISAEGLCLRLEWGGIMLSEQVIKWQQVAAIQLVRRGSSSPNNWKINFRDTSGGTIMQFALGAIRGTQQRLELVKAIEKYAASVPVDAEVMSTLAPPAESSYTELWLSSLASAPQREKLTPLSPGHTLKQGSYIIDEKLGAGGQGVAYTAHSNIGGQYHQAAANPADTPEDTADLVIKETVLPVYVDSQARREAVERFERDAQLLLKLKHPNLVPLRDYFIEDHRAYLVLDRVKGNNLRQLVEMKGPLKPCHVVDLAGQMANILCYLHALNPEIIHRDFTPENLMIDQDGQLKLIDFGVAQELKSRTTATVVGKHAYLPPEQFRGKPTTQSDLYALGATLYFLLTGSDPEPLSRLNPLLDLEAQAREANSSIAIMVLDLSDQDRLMLSLLSSVIEHATELDTSRRTVCASDLLLELSGQSASAESARSTAFDDLAPEASVIDVKIAQEKPQEIATSLKIPQGSVHPDAGQEMIIRVTKEGLEAKEIMQEHEAR